MKTWIKVAAAASVVAVGIGVGAYVLTEGPALKTVSAEFPEAISIYPRSNVDILGVTVGQVTSVTPEGSYVKVTMTYPASLRLPADASAFVVLPSLVSDRYIQLGPPYTGGPVLPDHAVIPIARSHAPVEIDQIMNSLNTLDVALGPKGANRNGALSRLIAVGAANLGGEGSKIHNEFAALSQAVATLSGSRGSLVGVIDHLAAFTQTLANDNTGVAQVTNDLATVSDELDAERADLARALSNLSVALAEVNTFVHTNSAALTANLSGLETVTNAILAEKASLIQVLDDSPQALVNLADAYNPVTRTLDTRSDNTGGQSLQGYLCTTLGIEGVPSAVLDPVCAAAGKLPPVSPSGGAPGLPGGLSTPGATSGASGTAGGLASVLRRLIP